jgi:hypothetical protein
MLQTVPPGHTRFDAYVLILSLSNCHSVLNPAFAPFLPQRHLGRFGFLPSTRSISSSSIIKDSPHMHLSS